MNLSQTDAVNMFKKGDFIEHPRKEWGYGLVMEDQVRDLLKINFRGIGIKKYL